MSNSRVSKHAALSAQVTLAERQVLYRRRKIRLRAAGLRDTLQKRMADPKVLLWAAGVGFAAGEFMRARGGQQTEKPSSRSAAPKQAQVSFFERALQWTAMARSIAGLLQGNDSPEGSASTATE